jgi:hypothetical protein
MAKSLVMTAPWKSYADKEASMLKRKGWDVTVEKLRQPSKYGMRYEIYVHNDSPPKRKKK